MIVRINQIDVKKAEAFSGWDNLGPQGPIHFDWPHDTYAFELLILDRDEQAQSLADDFRRTQLRRLIPEVLAGLKGEDEQPVLRLDGPLVEGELLGVMDHLTDEAGQGCYSLSGVHKLHPSGPPPMVSVCLCHGLPHLAAVCVDPAIGLERSVRLRGLCLPREAVNSLLDAPADDQQRWSELLSDCSVALSTVKGLQALQVLSRRCSPEEAKARLMERLLRPARQERG